LIEEGLLSLEDEEISSESFETEEIISVSSDLNFVRQASVLFGYDLILEESIQVNA
jgi:hypothetical protein